MVNTKAKVGRGPGGCEGWPEARKQRRERRFDSWGQNVSICPVFTVDFVMFGMTAKTVGSMDWNFDCHS